MTGWGVGREEPWLEGTCWEELPAPAPPRAPPGDPSRGRLGPSWSEDARPPASSGVRVLMLGRRRCGLLLLSSTVGALAAVAAAVALSPVLPWAPLLPLALIAAGIGGWVVFSAACGSRGAIMLFLFALTFVINAQFRVRGAGDIQADWQSAMKFLFWMAAGVIGAPCLPPPRRLVSHTGSALWLFYITVALLGAPFSPLPGYSFGCALALLCLFAFAYALVERLSEAQILWTIVAALTLFNVGGWVVFYAVPELGTSAAWTQSGLMLRMCGLAGQATNLGAVCSVGVGATFVLWRGGHCRAGTALLLGGFAFLTLLKSDARTTEIATVLGIGLVVASRSSALMVAGAMGAACLAVLLQVFPQIPAMLGQGFSRSGDPTEIYTLTGRLEIWDFAMQQIRLSPVWGWGYNSSKAVLGGHIGFQNGLMVDSAHNMYLQSMLSVGLMGTVPLVLLLLWLTARSVVRPLPLVIYTLVLVLVSSVSDTDAIGTTPTLLTVVFFTASLWPGLVGAAPVRAAVRPGGPSPRLPPWAYPPPPGRMPAGAAPAGPPAARPPAARPPAARPPAARPPAASPPAASPGAAAFAGARPAARSPDAAGAARSAAAPLAGPGAAGPRAASAPGGGVAGGRTAAGQGPGAAVATGRAPAASAAASSGSSAARAPAAASAAAAVAASWAGVLEDAVAQGPGDAAAFAARSPAGPVAPPSSRAASAAAWSGDGGTGRAGDAGAGDGTAPGQGPDGAVAAEDRSASPDGRPCASSAADADGAAAPAPNDAAPNDAAPNDAAPDNAAPAAAASGDAAGAGSNAAAWRRRRSGRSSAPAQGYNGQPVLPATSWP